MIQVHYARGCTLAEAFYQSVFAPYQLIIVGDPLCRPWANIPQVKISGVKPDHNVKGTLTFRQQPPSQRTGNRSFRVVRQRFASGNVQAGGVLTLDTTLLPDGYQELRVVAVEAGLIQSQGREILPIITDNYGRKIEAKLISQDVITAGQSADNRCKLARLDRHKRLAEQPHRGPSGGRKRTNKNRSRPTWRRAGAITVIGIGNGGPRSHVIAPPIDVTVEIPREREGKRKLMTARTIHATCFGRSRTGNAGGRSAGRSGHRPSGPRYCLGPQSARAIARSDRTCRDDRHYPGRRVAAIVATGWLHALCNTGALSDVCRSNSSSSNSHARLWCRRSKGRGG